MDVSNQGFRRYAAVIAILVQLLMTVLDTNLVNVALPVLARNFSVSDSSIIWIVTIYQLFITMGLFPLAAAGDRYSHKRTFLWGVAIFSLASALCALAQGFAALLAARAMQGIGAACVMAVNTALVRMIYPPGLLGRGLALNGMTVAMAAAAGPTVAGIIMSIASWRWLFLINLPLGLLSFWLGYKMLPENPAHGRGQSFDWVGALANAAAFGLIFYGVGSLSRNGLTALAPLVAGIIIAIFYVRAQTRKASPMLPVDLFQNRSFTLSMATSVSSFIAQGVTMVSLPFLFYNVYEFSELTTGLLMTPWPLAIMIAAPLAARIVERHPHGPTAACGMGIFAAGLLLLLMLPASRPSAWDIAWRMAVCGAGFGLFQTPNNIIMVMTTPFNRSGGVGGMKGTARLTGQTLGATTTTLVFAGFAALLGAAKACIAFALAFALLAAIFSVSQKIPRQPPEAK